MVVLAGEDPEPSTPKGDITMADKTLFDLQSSASLHTYEQVFLFLFLTLFYCISFSLHIFFCFFLWLLFSFTSLSMFAPCFFRLFFRTHLIHYHDPKAMSHYPHFVCLSFFLYCSLAVEVYLAPFILFFCIICPLIFIFLVQL